MCRVTQSLNLSERIFGVYSKKSLITWVWTQTRGRKRSSNASWTFYPTSFRNISLHSSHDRYNRLSEYNDIKSPKFIAFNSCYKGCNVKRYLPAENGNILVALRSNRHGNNLLLRKSSLRLGLPFTLEWNFWLFVTYCK